MKKFYLLLSVVLFLSLGITSYAYGPDFDPVYYANKYPDVVNVFGTNDAEVMYNHYLKYGIKEGRFQNSTEEATGVTNPPVITATPVDTIPVEILPIEGYSTYVDVDIEHQLVTYFVDKEIALQSPCVTGNVKGKHDTPKGKFTVLTKVPGKRLKGPTWDCWVNRWMQFTSDACGFHDASWRSSFGGEIYKTDGSHGCVNLPKQAAYDLYNLIKVGTTVIVH